MLMVHTIDTVDGFFAFVEKHSLHTGKTIFRGHDSADYKLWPSIGRIGKAITDERFDTKLFEIWCLVKLAEAITRRIGEPTGRPASLAARTQGPIYTWTAGQHTLRLYFQPPLHTLTPDGVRWHHVPGGEPLMGFPDLAVSSQGPAGLGVALFDPKLRRRAGAPTEELYKLLGYFANLRHSQPPQGAILYYGPGEPAEYALRTLEGGDLRALGVDPEATQHALFDAAAAIAVHSAGLDDAELVLF